MTHHTGGCRCGAIRFRATASPIHVSYCHCGDCRRASGAPVSVFVGFRAQDIAFSGKTACSYGTAPVERTFCGTCGSPLSYVDARLAGEIYMMLGAMDTPTDYPPTVHGYWRERLDFFHIEDGLPHKETTTVPRPERDDI